MLLSTTDLAVRGRRPESNEEPIEIEIVWPAASNFSLRRNLYVEAQTTEVHHRKPKAAARTRRTQQMIEAAQRQGLEIFASSTNSAIGAVTYQIFDTFLHRYVGGRDLADLVPPRSDGFELDLETCELFVEGYTRDLLGRGHPLNELCHELLAAIGGVNTDMIAAQTAIMATLANCTSMPRPEWIQARLISECMRHEVFSPAGEVEVRVSQALMPYLEAWA